MNAVAEGDVVRDLVKLAVHRDLSCVSAGVRQQRKSVAARHYRMGNHEITVEEKFQDSNACAGNHAMPGRVSRMRWRTFRERLGEKIIAISGEAPLHCHRVENIVVDTAIERSPVASQNLADDGAAGFRTVTKMDVPLVIPHTVQRKSSDGCHSRCEVGLTEGAKAVLCAGVSVRIPRIERYT